MSWGNKHKGRKIGDRKNRKNWGQTPIFEVQIIGVCPQFFRFFLSPIFLCAFVSLCLFASYAFAQQRPLLTEDPRLIPNGSFVMESGFAYAHNAQFPLAGL